MFYNKWKKYNEIQLTENKVDLNIDFSINGLCTENPYISQRTPAPYKIKVIIIIVVVVSFLQTTLRPFRSCSFAKK